MVDPEQIRSLRAQGLTPKRIARSLGVRPAEVAEMVRRQAASATPVEPRVVDCRVSAGWSAGLGLDGDAAAWREYDERVASGAQGLVSVTVAKEHGRYGAVSICGYLVDVFCLGVKNAMGPRTESAVDYPGFLSNTFAPTNTRLSRSPSKSRAPWYSARSTTPVRSGSSRIPISSALVDISARFAARARSSSVIAGVRTSSPAPTIVQAQIINTLRRTVGDGKFLASSGF